MNARHRLNLAAAAVVFAGGAYLATPVQAEVALKVCSDAQWSAAINRAQEACGSSASIVADCVDGQLITREIYCY